MLFVKRIHFVSFRLNIHAYGYNSNNIYFTKNSRPTPPSNPSNPSNHINYGYVYSMKKIINTRLNAKSIIPSLHECVLSEYALLLMHSNNISYADGVSNIQYQNPRIIEYS